ncbi:hypothetical protein DOY81_005053 [Sarcophaga bullata]|nr:hypothetical protein DOY81_005053 [Sarcophaga bullata]
MPDDSNQNFVTETSNKHSNVPETKSLTFKDWKTLKDNETKSKTVNKQTKVKNGNRTNSKGQASLGFTLRYNSKPNSFNGINNFIVHGNVSGTGKFGYNAANIGWTYYNRQKDFLTNSNINPNNISCSPIDRNFPDDFFASDGIYPQTDMMQKPLPPIPFKNNVRSRNLLRELGRAQSRNNERNKKTPVNKQNNLKNSSQPVNNIISTKNTTALSEEPKVYVPNPNASKDGKAFIPKPKLPEENLQISKEEKKQQWKEYREAMKPFKNREFYNAKRVVQRLGKKDTSELNEKELFRLANAREVMAAHKARLTAKYSSYVKAEEKSNELGEIYVLKKPPSKDWEIGKGKPKENQNYAENQQYNNVESGRKILGGYVSFKGFIPGSILDGTSQRIQQKLTV